MMINFQIKFEGLNVIKADTISQIVLHDLVDDTEIVENDNRHFPWKIRVIPRIQ